MVKRFILLCVLLNFSSTHILPQFPPSLWEINITLILNGDYSIKEGNASYKGSYSFEIHWAGSMERDEEDYIVYHKYWELKNWEAQETAKFPDSSITLSKKDFQEKPSFAFNYIVEQEDEFHFYFLVNGFSAPQNKSESKYKLKFPFSEEGSRDPQSFDYNYFITKGTNKIFMDRTEIYNKKTNKTFKWSWKHEKWLDMQKKPMFLSHFHNVMVKVSIIPHYQ